MNQKIQEKTEELKKIKDQVIQKSEQAELLEDEIKEMEKKERESFTSKQTKKEEKERLENELVDIKRDIEKAEKRVAKKKEKEKEVVSRKREIEEREKKEENPDRRRSIERERWEAEDERRSLEKDLYEEEKILRKYYQEKESLEKRIKDFEKGEDQEELSGEDLLESKKESLKEIKSSLENLKNKEKSLEEEIKKQNKIKKRNDNFYRNYSEVKELLSEGDKEEAKRKIDLLMEMEDLSSDQQKKREDLLKKIEEEKSEKRTESRDEKDEKDIKKDEKEKEKKAKSEESEKIEESIKEEVEQKKEGKKRKEEGKIPSPEKSKEKIEEDEHNEKEKPKKDRVLENKDKDKKDEISGKKEEKEERESKKELTPEEINLIHQKVRKNLKSGNDLLVKIYAGLVDKGASSKNKEVASEIKKIEKIKEKASKKNPKLSLFKKIKKALFKTKKKPKQNLLEKEINIPNPEEDIFIDSNAKEVRAKFKSRVESEKFSKEEKENIVNKLNNHKKDLISGTNYLNEKEEVFSEKLKRAKKAKEELNKKQEKIFENKKEIEKDIAQITEEINSLNSQNIKKRLSEEIDKKEEEIKKLDLKTKSLLERKAKNEANLANFNSNLKLISKEKNTLNNELSEYENLKIKEIPEEKEPVSEDAEAVALNEQIKKREEEIERLKKVIEKEKEKESKEVAKRFAQIEEKIKKLSENAKKKEEPAASIEKVENLNQKVEGLRLNLKSDDIDPSKEGESTPINKKENEKEERLIPKPESEKSQKKEEEVKDSKIKEGSKKEESAPEKKDQESVSEKIIVSKEKLVEKDSAENDIGEDKKEDGLEGGKKSAEDAKNKKFKERGSKEEEIKTAKTKKEGYSSAKKEQNNFPEIYSNDEKEKNSDKIAKKGKIQTSKNIQGKKKKESKKGNVKSKRTVKNKKKKKISFGNRVKRFFRKIINIRPDNISTFKSRMLGVDISDHSIEILLLNKDKSIGSYGRVILREGIIKNGVILDQKGLVEALREVTAEAQPKPMNVREHKRKRRSILIKEEYKAIVCLPESKAYVQLLSFEDKKNIYKKVQDKMAEVIPYDSKDLYWDFVEVSTGNEKDSKIICVAAKKDVVDSYIHFFRSINIDPVAFEVEGNSIGRALLSFNYGALKKKKKKEKRPSGGRDKMVLDMGDKTTTMSIFNVSNLPVLSVSIPYAGYYFTKKVSKNLNLTFEEAEELKQKEGFDPEGKTYPILSEIGKKLIKEIRDAEDYYRREFGTGIKEVVLAGGSALLPGILEFFQSQIKGIDFTIGDPLREVEDMNLFDKEESVLYANVVGLALRAMDEDPIEGGINLLPDDVKKQESKKQEEKKKSVFFAALLISIMGLSLLGLAIYYIFFVSFPDEFIPLERRFDTIIEEVEDREVTMILISDELDQDPIIYTNPTQDSDPVGRVTRGDRYEMAEEEGDWVRVVSNVDPSISGWINYENLKLEEVEEEEESEDEEYEDQPEEVEETEDLE